MSKSATGWLPMHHAPVAPGAEARVLEAIRNNKLGGGGRWGAECEALLASLTGAQYVLMTTSCSQALAMAAFLSGIAPGDEVILPSWTFASAASAFAAMGAHPVFVDVSHGTLNLDPAAVEAAISPRTRAVCVTHYAGVAADLAAIQTLCNRHGLFLIEDAAQGLCARHSQRHLGTIAPLGVLSFHATKSVGAGEAGALLINDAALFPAAEIVREKGTNRRAFERGMLASHSWAAPSTVGGPSELVCAYLSAQLEQARSWCAQRKLIWNRYTEMLPALSPKVVLPEVPDYAEPNASMFPVRVPAHKRQRIIERFESAGIQAMAHYHPLHLSRYAEEKGLAPAGGLPVTEEAFASLVRLPLHVAMTADDADRVIEALSATLN